MVLHAGEADILNVAKLTHPKFGFKEAHAEQLVKGLTKQRGSSVGGGSSSGGGGGGGGGGGDDDDSAQPPPKLDHFYEIKFQGTLPPCVLVVTGCTS